MSEPFRRSAPPPAPRPQRASDADRAYVGRVVHEAVGMGMLTLDEADERLRAVYAAQYRDQLAALIDDLPVSEPPMGAPAVGTAEFDRWERVQAATWRGAESAQHVLTRTRLGAWVLFVLIFMIILALLANAAMPGGGVHGGGGGMHVR